MKETSGDIINEKDILTFDKIAKVVIHNKSVGYWLLGFFLIVAWNATGFFSILQYRKWLFEPLRNILTTNILFFFTLVGLKYLKNSFLITLEKYTTGISEKSFNSFNFVYKKVWWVLFLLLIISQLVWFMNGYFYILHHPDKVGTFPHTGANLGVLLLLYETIVSTVLFIIFVDLINIGFSIFIFPFKVKKNLKINIISGDKCGGNAEMGNLLLSYIKIYFILLVIGTLGRYPGRNHPEFWYYLVLVLIAWLFGIFLFFFPMYPVKKQLEAIKLKKLKEIEKKNKSLLRKFK